MVCAGCVADRGAPDTVAPPLDLPSAGTATLRPETIILSDAQLRGAVVFSDHIIFPLDAPIDLAHGDVIVSGTGDGFIRRVRLVENAGDVLRVFTSRATLGDAVVDARFHATLFETAAFTETLEARTDWLTGDVDGAFSLAPTLDLRFAVADSTLASFELGLTGTATSTLAGTFEFTSANHWQWGDEKRADTLLFRHAFALGPLPIVVVGRFSTVFDATTYFEQPVTMNVDAAATLALDAGARYAPGAGWTTTDASTITVDHVGPTHDGAGYAALVTGVFPHLEVSLFGTPTADLFLSAQTGATGLDCNATAMTQQQALLQGAARFQLAAFTGAPEALLPLWDRGFSLDDAEQCVP